MPCPGSSAARCRPCHGVDLRVRTHRCNCSPRTRPRAGIKAFLFIRSSPNILSPWIKGATTDMPVATNAEVRIERYLWPCSLEWIFAVTVNAPNITTYKPMKMVLAWIASPGAGKLEYGEIN